MTNDAKDNFKRLIESNIDKYGFHVTVVGSSNQPRYAYTIGLNKVFNFELVFAGGTNYVYDELSLIFNGIVSQLKSDVDEYRGQIQIGSLGAFFLSPADPSWSKLMMLGVFDYYGITEIRAVQIIPEQKYRTLDVPDMSKKWNPSSEPVWQWFAGKWTYGVPENSTVVTNIDALLGEAVTEVTRWEEDEWEMFAGSGPDVEEKNMRVIPLATIIGIDRTLLPVIKLDIGKGIWREDIDASWKDWE